MCSVDACIYFLWVVSGFWPVHFGFSNSLSYACFRCAFTSFSMFVTVWCCWKLSLFSLVCWFCLPQFRYDLWWRLFLLSWFCSLHCWPGWGLLCRGLLVLYPCPCTTGWTLVGFLRKAQVQLYGLWQVCQVGQLLNEKTSEKDWSHRRKTVKQVASIAI